MIIIRCKQCHKKIPVERGVDSICPYCGFSNFVEKPNIVFNEKSYEKEKKLYEDLYRLKHYYENKKVKVDEVVSDLKKRGYPGWFIDRVIKELDLS